MGKSTAFTKQTLWAPLLKVLTGTESQELWGAAYQKFGPCHMRLQTFVFQWERACLFYIPNFIVTEVSLKQRTPLKNAIPKPQQPLFSSPGFWLMIRSSISGSSQKAVSQLSQKPIQICTLGCFALIPPRCILKSQRGDLEIWEDLGKGACERHEQWVLSWPQPEKQRKEERGAMRRCSTQGPPQFRVISRGS